MCRCAIITEVLLWSIPTARPLLRFIPHVVHVKLRDGLPEGCVCNSVCVCCCLTGGWAPCTADLGGESHFYGHSMLREGLFMASGYCFLKVWLLLLERSIGRTESKEKIIPVHAVGASEWIICLEFIARKWHAGPCVAGTLCLCYLGDDTNINMRTVLQLQRHMRKWRIRRSRPIRNMHAGVHHQNSRWPRWCALLFSSHWQI